MNPNDESVYAPHSEAVLGEKAWTKKKQQIDDETSPNNLRTAIGPTAQITAPMAIPTTVGKNPLEKPHTSGGVKPMAGPCAVCTDPFCGFVPIPTTLARAWGGS